jgi:hypothetical protein
MVVNWLLEWLPGELGADFAYWLSQRRKRSTDQVSLERKKILTRRAKEEKNRRKAR